MESKPKIFKDKAAKFEFLRSVACGLSSSAVDFLLTAIIIYVSGHEHYANFWGAFTGIAANGSVYTPPTSMYIIATTIGFIVSVSLNYILSVLYVYRYGNIGKNKKGFIKFIILSLIGLGMTSLFSYIGYDVLGCNLWLTKLVVSLIVFVFNFFTRKRFVFNLNLIRDDEHTIQL